MDRATVEQLLGNVQNDDEARALLALLQRENAKTEIIVTVRNGANKRRRYVVSHEDRDELRQFVGMSPEPDEYGEGGFDRLWRHWFGARWLRAYGKVDEMYRSLSMSDVVKVEEADPAKVWGS